MIAREHSAGIHGDEITFFDLCVARNAVALRAVCAGDNDGVERIAVCTRFAHEELNLQRNFALRYAFLDIGEDVLKRSVCDGLCVTDPLHFLIALDDALLADGIVQGRIQNRLSAALFGELLKTLRMTVGQSGVFHVHLGDAVLFQKRLIGFVKRGELHNLHILRLGACGLGVTEIEEIISLLGSEQQCAVCGRERREVIEVRFGNDQRRFFAIAADDRIGKTFDRIAH